MGLERECRVVLGRLRFTAEVQLETNELIVRGTTRTVVPFARLESLRADGPWLRFELDGEPAALELGEAEVARWLDRIRNPKNRLDKLGVKPALRVAAVDVDDPDFAGELAQREVTVAQARAGAGLDLVFIGATRKTQLARLAALRDAIRPEGAVWVTWPKGRPELREDDVRAAALKVGLVDVKVVAFSDRLSGLKLVIPLAKRPQAAPKAAPKAAPRPKAAARAATSAGRRRTPVAARAAGSSRAPKRSDPRRSRRKS